MRLLSWNDALNLPLPQHGSCAWKHNLINPLIIQSRLLMTLGKKPFENIVVGENAGNQHFLLFPLCFLSFPNQFQFSFPFYTGPARVAQW